MRSEVKDIYVHNIGKKCRGNNESIFNIFKLINVYNQAVNISKVNFDHCLTGIYYAGGQETNFSTTRYVPRNRAGSDRKIWQVNATRMFAYYQT